MPHKIYWWFKLKCIEMIIHIIWAILPPVGCNVFSNFELADMNYSPIGEDSPLKKSLEIIELIFNQSTIKPSKLHIMWPKCVIKGIVNIN